MHYQMSMSQRYKSYDFFYYYYKITNCYYYRYYVITILIVISILNYCYNYYEKLSKKSFLFLLHFRNLTKVTCVFNMLKQLNKNTSHATTHSKLLFR